MQIEKLFVNRRKVAIEARKRKRLIAMVDVSRKKKLSSQAKIITYISSNPTIATVSSRGTVFVKKTGKCKIYVISQNGITKSIQLTIT